MYAHEGHNASCSFYRRLMQTGRELKSVLVPGLRLRLVLVSDKFIFQGRIKHQQPLVFGSQSSHLMFSVYYNSNGLFLLLILLPAKPANEQYFGVGVGIRASDPRLDSDAGDRRDENLSFFTALTKALHAVSLVGRTPGCRLQMMPRLGLGPGL